MIFNNEVITEETIIKTRQHFADIAEGCITEVLDGKVKLPSHVTNEHYFERQRERVTEYLAGEHDSTFTFMQCAYWIQTGKMIALLP